MEKRSVPRIGRVLDFVGLGLFLVGGGVYLRAWIGFGGVRHYRPGPRDPLWAATHLANRYLRLQHIGVAIMAVGLAVFVTAWWVARRVRGPNALAGSPAGAADASSPSGEGS